MYNRQYIRSAVHDRRNMWVVCVFVGGGGEHSAVQDATILYILDVQYNRTRFKLNATFGSRRHMYNLANQSVWELRRTHSTAGTRTALGFLVTASSIVFAIAEPTD